MITGTFGEHGRPYVQGILSLPRFGVAQAVDFLLDTGADRTTLNPTDGGRLEVPFEKLKGGQTVQGIVGITQLFTEQAVLVFGDEHRFYILQTDIFIGTPSKYANQLPSLLGRDVLDRARMEYDPRHGRLELSVHADAQGVSIWES